MRGWRAKPRQEVIAVWDVHPVRVASWLEPLFALGMNGDDASRRGEAQSATNGTRFNGGLGPLQTFGRVYGFSPAAVRVPGPSMPSANGGQPASNTALLDLLGATVG
jgi:hypothetical protein